MHAYNASTGKGIVTQVDMESDKKPLPSIDDLDAQLRKLEKLKEDGLITEEEFKEKREELMK